ncbi:MAG: lysophospholipid acyltransferase family protein [Candidatus Falkowbacteria bacterium]
MIFSFFHYITWIVICIIKKLFFNFKVVGRENIKELKSGGVLFVANHRGKFDPFLIGGSIPLFYFRRIKCFRYLTYYKQIIREWYGFIIWLIGAYPVYKYKGDLEKSLSRTIKILKDNQSVLMFPSGGRNRYFKTKNARPGVGYLAKEINQLIVPVFIKNTYSFNFKNFLLSKRNISVIFGKPFRYEEVADKDMNYHEIATRIMERVEELSKL